MLEFNGYAVQVRADGSLGVFADVFFGPAMLILQFQGEHLTAKEVEAKLGWDHPHYLQIGADTFLGPCKGSPGDYVNHSCAPNAYVQNTVLVALKPIQAGEEITFDYSLTSTVACSTFQCTCGASNCRGVVGDYSTIPANERAGKKKYAPAHIKSLL